MALMPLPRLVASFSIVIVGVVLAGCGKSDSTSAGSGSPAALPPPPPPPPPAPKLATTVAGQYQVPAASAAKGLPTRPAAYVFVTTGAAIHVGTTAVFADATTTDLGSLRALLPPVPSPAPAAGAAAADRDAGADLGGLLGEEVGEMHGGWGFGPSGFAPSGGGTGMGTIGIGSGYGVGGAVRYTSVGLAEPTDPATARIVLVADGGVSVDALDGILTQIGEPVAVVVDGGAAGAGALALTLRRGWADNLGTEIAIQDGRADLTDNNKGTMTSVPAAAGGRVDRAALATALTSPLARPDGGTARVQLTLRPRDRFETLVVVLDAVAGRAGPVSIRTLTARGMRGRDDSVPQVRIGQPDAVGDLDKAIIRRYIKRSISKISYCYEKVLLAKPGLAGTVMTKFVITAQGLVATATAVGVDGEVASCVAGVIRAIEFPKPKGGGIVQVNYPFVFRPAGG